MNKKAAVLAITCIMAVFLTVLGAAFIARSVQEKNLAVMFSDSAESFWIAEAGLARGYNELSNYLYCADALNNWSDLEENFAEGSYRVTLSLCDQGIRMQSEGSSRSGVKAVAAEFSCIPFPFENTLSAGGDISLSGLLARVEVYGKTRISGSYSGSRWASGWFEDKVEGVDPSQTTLEIPDYDDDGTTDEFDDFVVFGRETTSSYPEEERVYIQTDGDVLIYPDSSYVGKKVVFVEGSSPGAGNVFIVFDSTWQEDEDLTVISTGDVSYLEPLQFQEDARLSVISWGDYSEASIFRSEHESVIYSHHDANFVDILDWGSTTGNIIANNNISLLEVLTYEKYYYSERALNGDLPAGFDRLAGGNGILSNHLINWQEANAVQPVDRMQSDSVQPAGRQVAGRR